MFYDQQDLIITTYIKFDTSAAITTIKSTIQIVALIVIVGAQHKLHK